MSTAYLGVLRCVRCGAEVAESDAYVVCARCEAQGELLHAYPAYDLSVLPTNWRPDPARPGLFRWQDLLPFNDQTTVVSLGEGNSPLLPLASLGRELGLPSLFLKDESRGPTWSYKDRLAATAVTKAVQHGAQTVVVSSTGNHGAAVAAYAATAGLRCVVLTVASVPQTMKVLMQSYGAHVVALENPPDRWTLMAQAVAEYGWVPMSGFRNPPSGSNPFGVEGYKTIAYELVEQLGSAPDVVVAPVAYGDGIMGLYRGFADLRALGWIDREPRLIAAEVFGSYTRAATTGPGAPSTMPAGASVAFSIATPTSSYQGQYAIEHSGGTAAALADDDTIMAMQHRLASTQGSYLEASSVLPLAVLPDLLARGAIGATETVVCLGTASGLKDIGSTAQRLPEVELIEPTFAALTASLAAAGY